MTPQHQVGVNEASGWSRCARRRVSVGYVRMRECVCSEQNREESLCSPSAGGEASGRRAASDSEEEK